MKDKHSDNRSYSQLVNLRVNTSQLKIGMYVSKLDRPWEQTPFKLQGFLIKSPEHIDEVKRYCDYVYIDQEKSITIRDKHIPTRISSGASTKTVKRVIRSRVTPQSTNKKSKSKSWETGHHFTQRDLEPAQKTYKETSKLVKSIMHDVKLGHVIDAPSVKEAVAACVDNIVHHADAMTLMSRLRNKDEYTSEHSLNVAIISITLGRHAGMETQQLQEIGLCGLLHDMGKMLTPEQILNKAGPLTDDEKVIMQQHPVNGRDILSSTSGIFYEAIHVAHAHHERIDGNGYPQGLVGKDISLYNRIVTIADVFDAITGDRAYNSGATVETALRFLHDGRGERFDPILVTQFIENIGIYPLGTVVEMQNGEIGIVVNTNYEHRLRPWVKIILDKAHAPCEPFLVNLSASDLDQEGNPYWIKASHNPRNFGIDLFKHIHAQLD